MGEFLRDAVDSQRFKASKRFATLQRDFATQRRKELSSCSSCSIAVQ